ncbi:MAG: cytoplasmic protein [Planctomycetes bacterium]|nr:cytoplasmic protein [Planctomycetota bacterium]
MDGRDACPSGAEIDALIARITAETGDDDGSLRAFLDALRDRLPLPADAHVLDEPVAVIRLAYGGNPRQGILAVCKRGAIERAISLSDIALPRSSPAALHVAAYRKWCGLDPWPEADAPSLSPVRRGPKAAPEDVTPGERIDLVLLAQKTGSLRCRILGASRVITLRVSADAFLVPGEIVSFLPRKYWFHNRHPYASGEILDHRIDVPALGLVPLELRPLEEWDPHDEQWEDEIPTCLERILAAGPRPSFALEPADGARDLEGDAIGRAHEARESGDPDLARDILTRLLEEDLRCLEAHADLGEYESPVLPRVAMRHFEMGMRIGELSLPQDFRGVLPWPCPGNRSFLRCIRGHAISHWRLSHFAEAADELDRLLWLNPRDEQDVQPIIDRVRVREPWRSET